MIDSFPFLPPFNQFDRFEKSEPGEYGKTTQSLIFCQNLLRFRNNMSVLSIMDKIIINNIDYTYLVSKAVYLFWGTKSRQLINSGDSSNRGAVVGGKQMDGFIELLKKVAIDAGVPTDNIITDKNYLPGSSVRLRTGICLLLLRQAN